MRTACQNTIKALIIIKTVIVLNHRNLIHASLINWNNEGHWPKALQFHHHITITQTSW